MEKDKHRIYKSRVTVGINSHLVWRIRCPNYPRGILGAMTFGMALYKFRNGICCNGY